jgi:signal transduction histidine kinase
VVLAALTYLLLRLSLEHRWLLVWGSSTVPGVHGDGAPPAIAVRLREQTLAELLTQSAVALTVVTPLAAVLGWLMAGWVLQPISAIAATARRLSVENLSERVPVRPPADELAALAETFNGMLDRIQQGVADRDRLLEGQRMFVANAAHELRTPLTTIRTAIDVTLDGEPSTAELLAMAVDIRTAVEHSQRTLDGLLTLARSQAGAGKRRTVDLARVVAATLDGLGDQAAAQNVALSGDLRPAPVSGEPVLIERMVSNLLDNAVRHNDRGGHVTVTTGATAAAAFLHMANTGRQIVPGDADRLVEPFVRGPDDRTRTGGGAGLGLSIVRAIVAAHHGEVCLAARPTGGLDVTVRFPMRAGAVRNRPPLTS